MIEKQEDQNHNDELEQKINAHDNFLKQLKLDINSDGKAVATLISYLEEKYPNYWGDELNKIIKKTLQIEKDVSLKDAMFYLENIINNINTEKTKINFADDPEELDVTLKLHKIIRKRILKNWVSNVRSIPTGVDNEYLPDWWLLLQRSRGVYDKYFKQMHS